MTEILGILGLQGWGKTALTTWWAYTAYVNGFDIYSNYPLNFEHTLITSLEEAKKVRNGYLIFDEFWRWVHARTSQSNINKEMMAICLLNRKRNVSIIYNTQLPRTIDVILRDVTNYRYLPHMERHKDNKKYIHYIMRDLLDNESDEMFINVSIDEIGKLYSTFYEVEDIDVDKKESFLEVGVRYENNCINAIKKLKGFDAVHLPNSGIHSGLKGDIIIRVPGNKTFIADVKSTQGSGKVTICDNNHKIMDEMSNLMSGAKRWGWSSCILFPKLNKSGNFLNFPNNWYVYELKEDSYLLNARGKEIRYGKLILKSKILKNWSKSS